VANTQPTTKDSELMKFGEGHPNIIRLFDAIDSPRQLYLILEIAEGKMLKTILKESVGGKIT
jgi:hypothetical protein